MSLCRHLIIYSLSTLFLRIPLNQDGLLEINNDDTKNSNTETGECHDLLHDVQVIIIYMTTIQEYSD